MGTENLEKSNYQNSSPNSNDAVATIPLTIDENNVLEGAREVLKTIRPTWNDDNIKFKLFTDGITNKLVGCFHTDSKSSSPDVQQTTNIAKISAVQQDVVLVRVYGNKTDLLIDRKAETRNIQMLHSHGFAPCLYAIFRNGLAYEYVPGVTLTSETVAEPQVWSLIARHMAEMHKIQIDCGSDDQPMLCGKVQQFLDILPETYSDSQIDERVKANFLPIRQFKDEFAELYKHLAPLNSPMVFCHNDLLLGNVIYEKATDRITFIDYEYAGPNFQAFDIGNHFTEFAGVDVIDYSHYPSKEFQLKWLRCYLEVYHGPGKCVTDHDVFVLYVQTNKFALASHFLWTIWALIQAEHSTIDFDFVTFAQTRYNEYKARKDAFLALTYE